jgi:glycosyltransferase involved in cell wall biosynthesis
VRRADVIIGMGSSFGYELDVTPVRVLYEDMTVAQSPYPASRAKARWRARQKVLYDNADLCCAATPWVAESIAHDYRIPESKIAVVGFGTNILCEPVPKDWSRPRFLWVGVDWERKGGDILLAAFQRAKIPGATLDLVGRHPAVDVPGVRGHGIVRNEERLREFYEAATVFVMPSRFEPAGIVFFEAASAGTPCIGTATAGLPYNLGPSGLIVPPGDVVALADALSKMAQPEYARQFVKPALAHARGHTWTAVAGRIVSAVAQRFGPRLSMD